MSKRIYLPKPSPLPINRPLNPVIPSKAAAGPTKWNITPQVGNEATLIKNIRDTFGLNSPPFDTIDNDLLLLAFIPNCQIRNIDNTTYTRLRSKYKTCSHQTLEFYGDRILYGVISSLMIDVFGLENTPGFLTDLIQELTNNRTLTDIMLSKVACPYVRGAPYSIVDDRKFHNSCADSFEAMVGVLFYHAQKMNMDVIKTIKEWLLQNTNIAFYLSAYLQEQGITNIRNYTLLDKQKLVDKVNTRHRERLAVLEKERENLDPELYNTLLEKLNENYSLNDFAVKTIIINPTDTLGQIYQKLGWTYRSPQFNSDINSYSIIGYPHGTEKSIGYGQTPDEAIANARQYLTEMGYITPTIPLQRYFT